MLKKKTTSSAKAKHAIHDLNNILNSTINSISILEELVANENKSSEIVATLKTNFLRTSNIINELSEDSAKPYNIISLHSLIKDIKLTIKYIIPKEIKLQFRLGKNLSSVHGNYSDIYRVILNLIINASEAIKNSGLIIVSVKNSRKHDTILISIKDNGIGISSKNINHIFDEGYSTKKVKSNSGLGLAIIKNIITEHNGTINVHSKYRVGTEFIVSLPSFEKAEPKNKKKSLHSILLVDDDQIILELLSELLSSYNYKVTTAKDGKDALSKFRKSKFDLAIIDKTMPIIDGIELIETIRKKDSLISIILTTGSQETINAKYSTLNINAKIKKPWGFEDMLNCIEGLRR